MTNAQAALAAAALIHQKVEGQAAQSDARILRTADALLKWLKDNEF